MIRGYRALFVNRHAICCRLTATTVDVVRVLHGQMDPDKHLEPSEDQRWLNRAAAETRVRLCECISIGA